MSPSNKYFHFVIAGCLNQDYVLPISGPPQINVLGGNLAYAAVGLNLWGVTGGLLARIGKDYPKGWLDRFSSLGFDLSGIKVLREPLDSRRFMVHDDAVTTHDQNPVQHFSERGLSYPPSLLGYRDTKPGLSSRSTPLKNSIQISDIPEEYLEASAVHIGAIDYLSHMILPSVFRQGQATTITLSSDPGYMDPSFWEEIPGLISEISTFITREENIRNLFQGRRTDLWEMAAVLGDYGPENIVILTKTSGTYLFDRVNHRRWIVPNYPSKVVNPTGSGDAFAGAFLKGFRENYDPLEGALMGSIADSIVIEGNGVFFALDALPELVDARLLALRELVREV